MDGEEAPLATAAPFPATAEVMVVSGGMVSLKAAVTEVAAFIVTSPISAMHK